MRADGIRSVVYDLPGQLVEGLAAAATTQRLTPSEYLTRLVAGELVRTNAISLVGIRKEAS
ncbi:MAG: hypothetical protein ING19_08715 [Azospirillum sp.]|nr:hypothetical protein [Azospirillum sp.]